MLTLSVNAFINAFRVRLEIPIEEFLILRAPEERVAVCFRTEVVYF